jgi:uncharacterized membrane protein YphA (DoxX/SURF4 family)
MIGEDTNMASAAPSKGLNITLWVLQVLVALAFLASGGSKLAGAQQMVEVFEKVGIGQWFRYVTGLLEVGAGIGLLIPSVTFYGAAVLVCVMVGAVITHLAIIGGNPAPAVVLLVLSGVIAYFRRP